jgi:hypothetical protein
VTYPGFTPVGNATLVVANVLTCNKHSQYRPAAALKPFTSSMTCTVLVLATIPAMALLLNS